MRSCRRDARRAALDGALPPYVRDLAELADIFERMSRPEHAAVIFEARYDFDRVQAIFDEIERVTLSQ